MKRCYIVLAFYPLLVGVLTMLTVPYCVGRKSCSLMVVDIIENQFQVKAEQLLFLMGGIFSCYFVAWVFVATSLKVYRKRGWLRKKHAILLGLLMYVFGVLFFLPFSVSQLDNVGSSSISLVTVMSVAFTIIHFTHTKAIIHAILVGSLTGLGFWALAIRNNDELKINQQDADMV